MSEVTANGVRLHYIETGDGPETVIFSHSFLVDHRHFEPQIEALAREYRVLAYDHRDHGGSQLVESDYGMEDIYRDGVAFLEAAGSPPCHWIGLSTGGFVGLRIALRRPELLRSLVIMDSSAEAESWANRVKYTAMLTTVRRLGYKPVVNAGMKAMFGPSFLEQSDRRADREVWKQRLQANDRHGMVRFGNAIFARDSVADQLGEIDVPTLVVSGEHDAAINPSSARKTASAIPNAEFRTIADAGHLCTVEQPAAVNEVLHSFLAERR